MLSRHFYWRYLRPFHCSQTGRLVRWLWSLIQKGYFWCSSKIAFSLIIIQHFLSWSFVLQTVKPYFSCHINPLPIENYRFLDRLVSTLEEKKHHEVKLRESLKDLAVKRRELQNTLASSWPKQVCTNPSLFQYLLTQLHLKFKINMIHTYILLVNISFSPLENFANFFFWILIFLHMRTW